MSHNVSTCDLYLNKLCKSIYDSKHRPSIRQEVQDMMEDFTNAYMEDGMSEQEAREEAVKQMGNPEEAGEMFNKVYQVNCDWKTVLYTLFCFVIFHFLYRFMYSEASLYTLGSVPDYVNNIVGTGIIVLGLLISIMERRMGFAFFYAWGQNWRGSAFSNSGLICGVGLGFLCVSPKALFICVLSVCVILVLERAYIDNLRNKKEQDYLWETGIAQEDFDFRGYATIKDKKTKVQIPQAQQIHKGDMLMVNGISGFVLTVERLS